MFVIRGLYYHVLNHPNLNKHGHKFSCVEKYFPEANVTIGLKTPIWKNKLENMALWNTLVKALELGLNSFRTKFHKSIVTKWVNPTCEVHYNKYQALQNEKFWNTLFPNWRFQNRDYSCLIRLILWNTRQYWALPKITTVHTAQCEISLQIFRSQKTCQMNWNSILEKTGLEI